jgi:ribokinase
MNEPISDLIKQLETIPTPEARIVLMPHFCIDNYVNFGENPDSFINEIKDIMARGGGNLALSQDLKIGGKAANCASALSALGLGSFLVAKTDELGLILLQHLAKEGNVDISHVSGNGSLAFTTTIELTGANIMLSDPGSLSTFGPDNLTIEDIELIKQADIVCISDWGLNGRGTELAKYVFGLVKNKGQGKTFFDPGDPSPKKENVYREIIDLKKQVLEEGLVDILSVNVDEVDRYGGLDELKDLTRVDLHTEAFSASYYKDKETRNIPAFDIKPKRLTGAGDAWNAGDILGEVMGLPDELRLHLANAAAGFYISSPEGDHSRKKELIEFMNETPLRE